MSQALAHLFDNIIDFPVVTQEKSNEWYTPARYIEAAREVMDGIDLDPASCELANQTVRAKRYYSKEDDGLSKEWHGRVWCNPPYSMEGYPRGIEIGRQTASVGKLWIDRLIGEYQRGNTKEAILLAKADVKQIWFQPLWYYPICFTFDRVYFERPNLPPSRIMFGTVFVYLGPHEQKFINSFSKFGRIAKAIDTPRQTVVPLSLWEGSEHASLSTQAPQEATATDSTQALQPAHTSATNKEEP